jgi:predicted naringenin-chalcone synthase
MLALMGLAGDAFAEGIFARCGVERRHLGTPPELWSTTLQARTPHTERLLAGLAREAVDRLAVDPERIGVVVTGTYYSLGGPTLAHRLIEHCGLAPDTDKYHLLGVGCASAVPLLRLAAQALSDQPPGRQALVVAAECVSGFMTPCAPDSEKVKVVGSSLFGDGCAAALVELGGADRGGADPREAPRPAILASAVHQVPGTLDEVRFVVDADDSHMAMSRALPTIAEHDLPGLVDDFLARAGGLTRADVDHWVAHPGGRGILDGIQAGLGLDEQDVAASAAVLARRGNVGTPSSLFVLEETHRLRAPGAGERGVMVTIGPGVTVGLALLQW